MAWQAVVESTEWVTPTLRRVVVGGEGLAGLEVPDTTDTYVNLAFPPAGAPYGPRFEPAEVREQHEREWWPARRRYTVSGWDAGRGLLTLDFVVHGDTGVAGPWAATATRGDELVFEGPAGGYRPDPDADWHLMLGDESALPAVAASLAALPAGTPAVVRLVVDGPDHEVDLSAQDGVDLGWLHRSGGPADRHLLLAAVEELEVPSGRCHAFVHGEADEIRDVRRHLLQVRGLSRADMSCSPYWRRTMTDEAWRAVKRDYVAAMEAETA